MATPNPSALVEHIHGLTLACCLLAVIFAFIGAVLPNDDKH